MKNNFTGNTINMYFPFTFKLPLDPREIYSVGDQVLGEHVYAFHHQESMKDGIVPVISNINFDYIANKITITPRYKVYSSNKQELTLKDMCSSFEKSFQGTLHVPYKKLLKSISCGKNNIEIFFSSIPANMPFIFTLPDLSIYNVNQLPMTVSNREYATGPYYVESSENYSIIWPESSLPRKIGCK
jgi:hypothetical protein